MTAAFWWRKLLGAALLLLGVTLVSFLLMVYFGPDQTYLLVGKNTSAEEIAAMRRELGYDQPFLQRYWDYLQALVQLDLGRSNTTGEPVLRLLGRTLPVSLALVLPGFILGNLLGIGLGLMAAHRRGQWLDRVITSASVVGMSLSFLVIIIALQILLCTPFGLNWFPVRGWATGSLSQYLHHVTVPTLAIILVTLGYNTRFYRAVLVEELARDHVMTARAYGATPFYLMTRHVLGNALVPIITRLMFSLPMVLVSGSLLLETYFGIPGVGMATFQAITSGDQPILKAVVGLSGVVFGVVVIATDLMYRWADPRIRLI